MAQANQVQIPVIQADLEQIVQIQQNVNKVLRNINNQVVEVQNKVAQTEIIGEIKIANLTITQFQMVAGVDWYLCNGQSCVGTSYSQLTGNNVVPTLTVGGFNTFIRVN